MAEIRAELLDALSSEYLEMSAITNILQNEQKLLVSAEVTLLSEVNRQKTERVTKSSELSRTRYRLLKAAGYDANETGMTRFIQTLAPRDEIQTPWKMLLLETAKAKELNRLNGVLIGQHLSRNSAALAALGATKHHTGTYGPDGQATRHRTRGITA